LLRAEFLVGIKRIASSNKVAIWQTHNHWGKHMSHRTLSLAIAIAGALTIAGSAHAASVKLLAMIPVPGEPIESYDIGTVDEKTHLYYQTDRSNKSIDIFNAVKNAFVGRVAGFVGFTGNGNTSGGNGVSLVNNGTELWSGDGDSTVKVIDLKARKIVDTISTGGKKRANETDYDPVDQIFLVGNDGTEGVEPSFVTLISTKPGHKILARIPIERARQIDAPRYNPKNGLFYVSLPVIDKTDAKGGIAVIDPREAKVLRIIEVMDCAPQGLALGADDHMIIGCNAGSSGSRIPPLTAVFDIKTEKVIASTPKMGGSDMAGYVEKLGLYVVGGREAPGGSSIGLLDAKTNEWIQNIPAPPNAHSVVISQANAHMLVPSGKTGGFCGGCILVFGEK